jgi:hypothetical protein
MRIIFGLILVLFLNANTLEAKIVVEENEDGIFIEFSGLEYELDVREDIRAWRINNADPRFTNLNTEKGFDEIEILFAYPEDSEIFYEREGFGDNHLALLPKIELKKIGKMRGIPVARLRIIPENIADDIAFFEEGKIKISYPNPVSLPAIELPSLQKNFYSRITNKAMLGKLYSDINSEKKTTEYQLFSEDDWFDPSQEWIKLSTKKDGIAYILAEDIISTNGAFSGVSLGKLQLMHRGEPYPFYVDNDMNGVLNAGDVILFEGRHADGDTTWYDFYTDEEVFYLTISDEKSLQLSLEDLDKQWDTELNKLPVYTHYEKDSLHSSGIYLYQIFTEHVLGQGWKWQELDYNEYEEQTLVHNFTFFSDAPLKNLTLKAYMSSLEFVDSNKYEFLKHNYSVHLNNVEIIKNHFERATSLELDVDISDHILNGLNKIEFKYEPNYYKGILVDGEKINIDWFEIEASMAPRALDGKFFFEYTNQLESAHVRIPGFGSSNVHAIDKKNNKISKLATEQGIEINLAATLYEHPSLSVMMNDNSYITQEIKVALAYMDQDNTARIVVQGDEGIDLNSIVNSIPDGNVFVVISNLAESMNASLIDLAKKSGAIEIEQIGEGETYAFIGKKNSGKSIYESRGPLVEMNRFVPDNNSGYYRASMTLEPESEFDFVISDQSNMEQASLHSVKNTVLKNPEIRADYIVVYHPAFESGAQELARYRAEHENVSTIAVDVFDIYKEFNYGKKSIHAIKDFFRYAYENWQKPAPLYVVLVGDACWDTKGILQNTVNYDFIPTHGWPVSDYWYTLLDEKEDYWYSFIDYTYDPDYEITHEIILGRLPVKSTEEMNIVLEKLKAYDEAPILPWMKKFLMLSGGTNDQERSNFRFYSMQFLDQIIEPLLCADTTYISKRDPVVTGTLEAPEIINNINNGATWVNFLGHASSQRFDMDGWNSDRLSNKGKYSVFSTISCNTGAYASPKVDSRAEEYLLEPDKGFVAAFSSTFVGFILTESKLFRESLNSLVLEDREIRYLGDIGFYAKSKMYNKSSELITTMQYGFLGDPLTKLRIGYKPDLYLVDEEISFVNSMNETLIREKDSTIYLSGKIYNNGLYAEEDIELKLIHEYNGEDSAYTREFSGICLEADFEFEIDITDKPGRHRFILKIDDDGVVDEENKDNNNLSMNVEVFKESLLPVEPLSFWHTDQYKLHFRVINPLIGDEEENFDYDFRIYDNVALEGDPIYVSEQSEITVAENYVDWKTHKNLEEYSNYFLAARATFGENFQSTDWLIVPFSTKNLATDDIVRWSQSAFDHFRYNKIENLEEYVYERKNVEYEALRLSQNPVEFYVSSSFGDYSLDPPVPSDAFVRVGDEVYVDYLDSDLVGIYLVVLNGNDASFVDKRYYNTFKDQEEALEMVNFLRDTIDPANFMILTVAGPGFNAFGDIRTEDPESIASMDSLKVLFSEFGGILCDSLEHWRHSYCILGKKGWERGKAFEAHDTAQLFVDFTEEIVFARDTGMVELPLIGPAKEWKRLQFIGFIRSDQASIKTTIYGVGETGYSKLLKESWDNVVNISDINAEEYPYIQVEFEMARRGEDLDFNFIGFEVDFVPDAELAAVDSKTFPIEETVLRGDSISMQFALENISLRTSADDILTDVTISKEGAAPTQFSYIEEKLDKNLEFLFNDRYETINFTGKNTVKLSPNLDRKVHELYYFNNDTEFEIDIYEDDELPWIKVFLDSIEVEEDDFVSITPEVRIEIYDNSRLPIDEYDVLTRINTTWPCDKPGKCSFESFGNNIDLKAVVTFKSDSLDIGNSNVIEIKYEDGTGNKNVYKRTVYVAKSGTIDNLLVFPNPFQSNGTNIRFDYHAPDHGGMAEIEIFNTTGQLVRKLSEKVRLGENIISWDGLDRADRSLPTGMYYFTITVKDVFSVERHYGKVAHIND